MPSRLKFLKVPSTFLPLKVKLMTGIVRSRAQPITSPLRMYGCVASGITQVLRPPVPNTELYLIAAVLRGIPPALTCPQIRSVEAERIKVVSYAISAPLLSSPRIRCIPKITTSLKFSEKLPHSRNGNKTNPEVLAQPIRR